MSPLAEKLKRLRERHDLTQQVVANKSGLALRTIAGVERGEPLSKDTLLKILSAYKIPKNERVDFLMAWVRGELDEYADDIYMRKAEGLQGIERFSHILQQLTDSEREKLLTTMEDRDALGTLVAVAETLRERGKKKT